MSENSKIISALHKAQKAVGNAKKDSKNPFHNSKYANLESVIDAIKDPLNDNDLVYCQTYEDDGGPYTFLKTTLYHVSGESISGKSRLVLSKQDMQQFGSATSYARRYALLAIVGIFQEDDDGNATIKKPPAALEGEFHNDNEGSTVAPIKPVVKPWQVGAQELRTLQALINKCGMSVDKVESWCTKKFPHFINFEHLNEQQFDILVIKLKEEIDKLGVK